MQTNIAFNSVGGDAYLFNGTHYQCLVSCFFWLEDLEALVCIAGKALDVSCTA